MEWKNLSPKNKRAWAIIIVFGIILGYIALAWSGLIPSDYNVIEQYFGGEGTPDAGNNTTVNTGNSYSEVTVTGIPPMVNTSLASVNTYEIQFMAVDGGSGSYTIRLMDNTMTNATFELSNTDGNWLIGDNGHYASYQGGALIPYEYTTVSLTIEGNQFTRSGSIMVICSSDGETSANEGLIFVHT